MDSVGRPREARQREALEEVDQRSLCLSQALPYLAYTAWHLAQFALYPLSHTTRA